MDRHDENYRSDNEDKKYWFAERIETAQSHADVWNGERPNRLVFLYRIPRGSAEDGMGNYHSVMKSDIEIVQKLWLR